VKLLTAEDVAAQLQVPTSWVYRAAREGDLPSVPCGRYVRFDPDDIAAWIMRRKTSRSDPNVATLRSGTNTVRPALLEQPGR
jgi:excisionase family DNA binding protein